MFWSLSMAAANISIWWFWPGFDLSVSLLRRGPRSGQLDRNEFKAALKAAKLGLTRKDINLIMSSADTNNDGLVSYDEFIPVCFQVCCRKGFSWDLS